MASKSWAAKMMNTGMKPSASSADKKTGDMPAGKMGRKKRMTEKLMSMNKGGK